MYILLSHFLPTPSNPQSHHLRCSHSPPSKKCATLPKKERTEPKSPKILNFPTNHRVQPTPSLGGCSTNRRISGRQGTGFAVKALLKPTNLPKLLLHVEHWKANGNKPAANEPRGLMAMCKKIVGES